MNRGGEGKNELREAVSQQVEPYFSFLITQFVGCGA
jgi:hypothetical protein